MMTELAIKIGGGLSAALAIAHCLFYRGFGWKEDFDKSRLLTAKVLYTIHVFLIPFFLFFAYLSFVHTKELAGGTPLGIAITVFYSLFWFVREFWQVAYFKPSSLKGFEKLYPLHYFLVGYFFLLWCSYTFPLITLLSQ